MTIEGYDGERVLLSYDVSGAARTVASRVCQIIFGRVRISEGPARVRTRRRASSTAPAWCGSVRVSWWCLRVMQASYLTGCAGSAFV